MAGQPDISRYHRQTLLEGIGEDGQQRLASSHALLVGCGALGCTIADQLVRAGVGTLTIVDRDVVELTNLQRQSLFTERDAREALPKAEAAAARLKSVNSQVRVRAVVDDLTHRNAEAILASPGGTSPSVLLDGTDNFATRYLLNDLAVRHGIPFVYGGAVATRGMSMTILPSPPGSDPTPCLRCIFPDLPVPGTAQTCDTAGILGPVAAIVASCQAADAIKVLLGRADLCSRTLLEFDLWSNARRRIDLTNARDPECPCCGERRFEFLEGRLAQDAAVICTRTGGGSVQVAPSRESRAAPLDLPALARRLAPHGEFTVNTFLLRGTFAHERSDSAHPLELTVFRDGRAIVRGTTEPGFARAVYARYIGE
jgi:molybdopterin/thiamine biosynthesis adenylyltransferase